MPHPPGGRSQSRPQSDPKTISGVLLPNLKWISGPPKSAHPPSGTVHPEGL